LRFGITILLRQIDDLGRFGSHLHPQLASFACDRELAISEPSHQVERLSRRLLEREASRVLLHRAFDGRPHLRRGAEVPIRGHQTLERLVRPLEVVRVHEEPEPALEIREVGEDCPRQKLVPERLPESLDLPERLRMLRATLHVPDALATEPLLELCLAPPGGVLPSLIGEELARRTEVRDSALERFEHER
jgi:hypothetical protein